MATVLLGRHREVVCADCGFRFACAAEGPARPRAVCPNCGYAGNDLESLRVIEGDRLLFDRTAWMVRSPRRWEVVALRCPRDAGQIVVKRIVGLPGEKVELRRGAVYIDGEMARKDLAQQRELAVLVHDAGCGPSLEPQLPPRWRGEGACTEFCAQRDNCAMDGDSPIFADTKIGTVPVAGPERGWHAGDGRFTHTAGAAGEPIAWLVYHHWRRAAERRKAQTIGRVELAALGPPYYPSSKPP